MISISLPYASAFFQTAGLPGDMSPFLHSNTYSSYISGNLFLKAKATPAPITPTQLTVLILMSAA